MIAGHGGSQYSKFGKQPQSSRQQVMRGPYHKSINQHPQQAGPAAVASQYAAAVPSKTFHQGQGQTFNQGQGQQQQNVYNEVYGDRKSTRLNSSHLVISYAVFCLKKKKTLHTI